MQIVRTLPALLAAAAGWGLAVRGAAPDADPANGRATALALSDAFQEVCREASPGVVQVVAYRGGRQGTARGSGVVLRPDGLVATNCHVVAGAEQVVVTTAGGRRVEAEVLGLDPDTDLAVLDLPGDGHPTLALAPEDPAPGAWVLALGSPRGLGVGATFGIVSGGERSGLGIATFESFLQTDAAIAPGNSGGPLVDLHGRVVGINTARGLGGEPGIGFAIPASIVRSVVDALAESGRVPRGWLGIRMRELAPGVARDLGLPARPHVAVREVLAGSPAAAAGLREADVVLAVDGEAPADGRDLLERIAARDPGAEVALRVWRNGEAMDVAVELGRRD